MTPCSGASLSAHVMFVQRSDTTVERFPNVQQDGTWIRAISRLGVAFLNPEGVVRGWNSVKTYTLNFMALPVALRRLSGQGSARPRPSPSTRRIPL